jgi:hypothetical protein
LTPERQALHDQIFAEHFAGKTPIEGRAPVAYVFGGGSASGKSALEEGIDTRNVVKVDPDEIKKKFPEYDTMSNQGLKTGANFVHEESSYLSKRIVNAAVMGRYDFIMDGTGDTSAGSMLSKIDSYRRNGHTIEARYVSAPVKDALKRALERGKNTKRYVMPTVLKYNHREVSRIFPELVRRGVLDRFTLHDSSAGKGKNVLVASGERSNITIHDPGKWKTFLDKADVVI